MHTLFSLQTNEIMLNVRVKEYTRLITHFFSNCEISTLYKFLQVKTIFNKQLTKIFIVSLETIVI